QMTVMGMPKRSNRASSTTSGTVREANAENGKSAANATKTRACTSMPSANGPSGLPKRTLPKTIAEKEQDDPVRRENSKGAVTKVSPQTRQRIPTQDCRRERAVEEKPRKREEQNDAVCQVLHEAIKAAEGERCSSQAVRRAIRGKRECCTRRSRAGLRCR